MRGKHFGFLVMLLFVFVMLPVPSIADIVDCPDGSPDGALCATGIDSLGNAWMVTSIATSGVCDHTNNKGDSIPGTGFKYLITHPDLSIYDDVGVQQANVDFIVSVPSFTLTWPQNNAIKIRDCDPNTGFRCDDPNKDVVTSDSLQTTPSDQFAFDYCADPTSINSATIQLVTGEGNIIAEALGPGSCTNIQRITAATLSLPDGTVCDDSVTENCWTFGLVGSVGSVALSFDACSGDIIPPPHDAEVTTYEYELIQGGGYFCLGDEDSYDSRTCDLIQEYGPLPLGGIFATTRRIYVGFGPNVWGGPGVSSYPEIVKNVECQEASAHSPTSLTYGNDVTVELDWCGNLLNNGTIEDYPNIWYVEANSRGRRDDSTAGRILSGNGVFSGSCYIYKNGHWYKYPDSYCQ